MGSCSILVSSTWRRTVILLLVFMEVLLAAQLVAQDTTTMAQDTTTMAQDTTTMVQDTTTMAQDTTTTMKMESHSVTPKPVAVAPVRKKPKMVSNSTQTEDEPYISPTEKPVLITGLILAVAAACSAVLAIIVLIIIIIVAIKCYWERPSKAPPYDPPFGVPGEDQGYMPVFVDRKMAQSAQMFFYQFQKQQLLAQENEQKSRHGGDSDTCSEADTKDGHVPMVSCPGLAMQKNGEDLEVRNPMFFEDVPTWNGSVATDDEDSSRTGTDRGMVVPHDGSDGKEGEVTPTTTTTTTEPSSSLTPPQHSSSVSPHPPPSSPEVTTPSPPTGVGSSKPDDMTTDVNENLTQALRDPEVKSKDVADNP